MEGALDAATAAAAKATSAASAASASDTTSAATDGAAIPATSKRPSAVADDAISRDRGLSSMEHASVRLSLMLLHLWKLKWNASALRCRLALSRAGPFVSRCRMVASDAPLCPTSVGLPGRRQSRTCYMYQQDVHVYCCTCVHVYMYVMLLLLLCVCPRHRRDQPSRDRWRRAALACSLPAYHHSDGHPNRTATVRSNPGKSGT